MNNMVQCGQILVNESMPISPRGFANMVFSRYMSVFPCADEMCLVVKDNVIETKQVVFRSINHSFESSPKEDLILPWYMLHNTAFLPLNATSVVAVGGQYRTNELKGIFLVYSHDNLRTWSVPRHMLNGTHHNCIECRPDGLYGLSMRAYHNSCEFDGRLSLVFFKGVYYLYTRANVGIGARYVQVTTSQDLSNWSTFRPVQLSDRHLDIYFWGVQKHPIVSDLLLAIFPSAKRHTACIALATSSDGINWYMVGALKYCSTRGSRSQDHPVFGVVHDHGRRTSQFLVQSNVWYENRNYMTMCVSGLRWLASHLGFQDTIDVLAHSVMPLDYTPKISSLVIHDAVLKHYTQKAFASTVKKQVDGCLGTKTPITQSSTRLQMTCSATLLLVSGFLLCWYSRRAYTETN